MKDAEVLRASAENRISRPKLLFLSHHLPYPPDSGAAIRTMNVLKILGRRYAVTALCMSRKTASLAAGSPEDRARHLRAFCGDVSHFPIPAEDHSMRSLWDHIRSLATQKPWVNFLYDSKSFRARLDDLLAEHRFDLAHVDSLDLVSYLDRLVGMPKVLVHHNVESVLLRRRADAERHGLKKRYLALQARFLEREERRWCPRMDLNIVVSDEDRRRFRALAPHAEFAVFPNGVDVDHYQPVEGPRAGLVFVGGTTWFPNRDALVYFSSEILPLLRANGDDPEVKWVGHSSDADRESFGDARGLTLTGYVEDERPLVARAGCFIVPLRVGGGTRLKILNAWAMGKAVVSTSLGCEGLDARHEENILIADTPRDFAREVSRVLCDRRLCHHLEAEGRKSAVTRYSWEVIARSMVETYDSVMSRSSLPAHCKSTNDT